MCSNNDWTATVPIFTHGGKFEIPERYILPSKRCNTTQFELIIDPDRSWMLQTFTVGVYHPIGCLAVDSWGLVGVSATKGHMNGEVEEKLEVLVLLLLM